MAYIPPIIETPVVLQGGYVIPAISTPVVLEDGGSTPALITGTLAATLPALELTLSCTVAAQIGIAAGLAVDLPIPLPALTCDAAGEFRITYIGALVVELPPPELPTLTCAAVAQLGIAAAAVATLPVVALLALSCTAAGERDNALPDADGVGTTARHQHARPSASGAATAQQHMIATAAAGHTLHAHGLPVGSATRTTHTHAQQLRRAARQRHTHGIPLAAGSRAVQANTLPLHRPTRAQHAHGLPLCNGAAARQTNTLSPGLHLGLPHQQARSASKGSSARNHQGKPATTRLVLLWQHGELPQPGRWWPWYEPPALGIGVVLQSPYTPRPLRCRVVLGPGYEIQPPCPIDPDEPGIVIPTQRTYIVINSVSLRRVDTDVAIQPLALDIGIDADGWVADFSASIAFDEWPALAAENGEPLELEAVINGQSWRLLAEGAPSRSRTFGQTSVQIKGRGLAAWLDADYADLVNVVSGAERTAQQLMADCLAINGVPLGWSLNWGLTDWVVPGNAWSHYGTPIAGVLDVASAFAAIVQADPVSKILHILPRYPVLPWEWADTPPDIEIPPSIIIGDTLEPVQRPDYNAVYVSGQGVGIVARVLRSGSAGDRIAPTVNHALITHADAGRQRGGAILADTGRQGKVSITLPLSDDTTLLQVGQLARFTEAADPWRGLVRGVRVSATWNSALTVRQTVELERHYE